MKRFLFCFHIVMITAIVVFSFSACGGKNNPTSAVSTSKSIENGHNNMDLNQRNENKSSGNGEDNGHRYIDLGLPSGTKWADCNVGASSATDYGNHYSWGETATKKEHFWRTYKYGNAEDELTKYCTDSDYGKDGRFSDSKMELDLDDDVAHKLWGGSWRMPSKEQFQELLAYTTNEWTRVNGIKGRLFKARNGNSLFFPAAGHHELDVYGKGSFGVYWSRTLRADNPSFAVYLDFNSQDAYLQTPIIYERYYGFSVRPIHF